MATDTINNIVQNAGEYGLTAWKYFTFAIVGIIGLLLVYGAIWYYVNKRRYNYEVVIREIGVDGKPRITAYDKGGLFIDKKTNYRLFLLRKSKVGLSPDNIPYEESPKGIKVVNVLKLGLKQFRFLERPALAINSPVAMSYGVGDFDVAWGINTIELAKQYEKKNMLTQLAPFIGMAFVFITVVVALYYIFVKAGFNADLLKQLATTAEAMSRNLAASSSGTTVVGG